MAKVKKKPVGNFRKTCEIILGMEAAGWPPFSLLKLPEEPLAPSLWPWARAAVVNSLIRVILAGGKRLNKSFR
jgi:hypothetical protein